MREDRRGRVRAICLASFASFVSIVSMMTGAIGCATGQSEEVPSSSSEDLRSGGRLGQHGGDLGQAGGVGNVAGRFSDWRRLSKALAGLDGGGCIAVSQAREDGTLAIVFPASCFFPDGGTQVRAASRPAVDIVARELTPVVNREFWIGARTPQADGDRISRDRAAALVSVLVAAGVPPARLAAIVGVDLGDSLKHAQPFPASFAGAALMEIVAAPTPILFQ